MERRVFRYIICRSNLVRGAPYRRPKDTVGENMETLNKQSTNVSKWSSECKKLAEQSYKCLESNNREECVPFFDEYKICKKNEHDSIIRERRQRLGTEN